MNDLPTPTTPTEGEALPIFKTSRRSFLSAIPAIAAASAVPAMSDQMQTAAVAEALAIDPVQAAKERVQYHLREYMAALEEAYGPIDDWEISDPEDRKRQVYVIGYRPRENAGARS